MTKLWRVRRTVHKMLHDRKYAVGNDDLTRSKEDVRVPGAPHPSDGARPPALARRSVLTLWLCPCSCVCAPVQDYVWGGASAGGPHHPGVADGRRGGHGACAPARMRREAGHSPRPARGPHPAAASGLARSRDARVPAPPDLCVLSGGGEGGREADKGAPPHTRAGRTR